MASPDQLHTDDAAMFKGAPVSLQIVSRIFSDGLVLAAQEVIERILKS